MNTFDIHSKITWHELIKQTDILPFYPSLTKKIDKSDEYFSQNFFIKVTPILDVDSNASDFFDLYEKEIGARENYIYKKDEQKEILKKNIENGRVYFLIGCYLKDNNKFCGGLIFSKKDGNFFSALRVFESQIRSQYKSQTTLDFWTEKEFYNYAKSEKVKFISHGTDNYPNIGRVGLPLFKLKVGAIPKISNKEHEIKKLTDQSFWIATPRFFFSIIRTKMIISNPATFFTKREKLTSRFWES